MAPKRTHGKEIGEQTREELLEEVECVRRRLEEAEQTLQAIQNGDVDALIVKGPEGEQVFSLTNAERLYRVIVETMNEAAVTVSEQGTVLFSNRRFCELVKIPLETVIGRAFSSFVSFQQLPQAHELIATADARPITRLTLLASDGTRVPTQICASSLESSEGPSVCLLASDLSELEASVQSVRMLREQREALEQARMGLSQSNDELNRARTGALNLMEDAVEARQKAEEHAEALRLSEERLRKLAERLELLVAERTDALTQSQQRLRSLACELNLAEQRERKRIATELHDHLQQTLVLGKLKLGGGKRFAAGLPVVEKIMKETDDVFSEALAYTRTLVAELSPPVLRDHGLAAGLKWLAEYMKKHEQTVTVTVPDGKRPELPDDQVALLFQSVRELLINSSKHAETGEAAIIMEQRDGTLSITVRDHGKGFDPGGVTPSGELSSKFGLFSIHERMRAMGGVFEIQSMPGQGTTATLRLPLVKSEQWARGNGENAIRVSLPSSGFSPPTPHYPFTTDQNNKHVRVLLVDDHAMVRQGLHSVLDAYEDVQVVGEAEDGATAVKLVEKLGPHVVVMDINMPKMNGIEATARIKTCWPETIVIGISVNTGDENCQSMTQAGAVTVLPKEAAVEQLHETIVRAVAVVPT